MKAKVSLIYADNHFQTVSDFPPLGGLYITSFLKQKGIDAHYYDFTIINNWKKKIHEIIDSNPEVIGLSSTVSNFSNTNFLLYSCITLIFVSFKSKTSLILLFKASTSIGTRNLFTPSSGINSDSPYTQQLN